MESHERELTEREKRIAQEAAKLAMAEMTNEVYRAVGKTFFQRILWVIGALAIGFGVSRGWIQFPDIKG